jgi:hypothetical protein
MEQDFAKRRTRTPLAEPDPQPQTSSMGLLFTGLVTGVAVGLFISLLVYMSGVLPPAPGQAAQSVHASVRSSGFATEPIGDATNGNGDQLTVELELEAARLQLEFYQELPNYEVVVDVTPVNVPQPRVITPPAQTASTQAASDSTPADLGCTSKLGRLPAASWGISAAEHRHRSSQPFDCAGAARQDSPGEHAWSHALSGPGWPLWHTGRDDAG